MSLPKYYRIKKGQFLLSNRHLFVNFTDRYEAKEIMIRILDYDSKGIYTEGQATKKSEVRVEVYLINKGKPISVDIMKRVIRGAFVPMTKDEVMLWNL